MSAICCILNDREAADDAAPQREGVSEGYRGHMQEYKKRGSKQRRRQPTV